MRDVFYPDRYWHPFIALIKSRFVLLIVIAKKQKTKNNNSVSGIFPGMLRSFLCVSLLCKTLRSWCVELIGCREEFSEGQIDLNLISQAYVVCRHETFFKTFSRTVLCSSFAEHRYFGTIVFLFLTLYQIFQCVCPCSICQVKKTFMKLFNSDISAFAVVIPTY